MTCAGPQRSPGRDDVWGNNPEVAAEYGRIKRQLAEQDAEDRVRYRAKKAPFIEGVLRTLEEH